MNVLYIIAHYAWKYQLYTNLVSAFVGRLIYKRGGYPRAELLINLATFIKIEREIRF